jgi:hypothetical protein
MHLFMIYIGGKAPQSLIELHDIRFVIAKSIEDTYSALRKSWWGTPESLHLDCWGVVEEVDGHTVTVSAQPPSDEDRKLYFANLGGYDPHQFTELHDNVLVIATNTVEAKSKALAKVKSKKWDVPHRDYLHEVESIKSLNEILAEQSLYIHLTPTNVDIPFKFTCKYVPIGTVIPV